jgi:hypothetical protein
MTTRRWTTDAESCILALKPESVPVTSIRQGNRLAGKIKKDAKAIFAAQNRNFFRNVAFLPQIFFL